MGLDHRVVEDQLPSIVEYAELGQFIDAPIKTYSSGMRARLGFAIATSVEPDILLLDEVLSTGDAAFREKSKQRVARARRQAKAIVLVTHDMNWVTEYCNRAMLIEQGRDRRRGRARGGRGRSTRSARPARDEQQAAGVFGAKAIARPPGAAAARR